MIGSLCSIKKKSVLTIPLVCINLLLFAQHSYQEIPRLYAGVGFGLTYGGIGGRILYNSNSMLSFFYGMGYHRVGLGYNFGAIMNLPSQTRVNVKLSAMYGINAAIKIKSDSDLNRLYKGLSFGGGIRIALRGNKEYTNKTNFLDLAIHVPFRSPDYQKDWSVIQNNSTIPVPRKPWPVLINLGYNLRLSK